MPTYDQNIQPGQRRLRIWAFNGTNPNALETAGSFPSLTFYEQEVVRLEDGSERPIRRTREVKVDFQNGKVVQLRDPTTDALLPGQTTTHNVIMAFLYALGRQAQAEADEAEAARNAPQPE